jgi:hypothetical protein
MHCRSVLIAFLYVFEKGPRVIDHRWCLFSFSGESTKKQIRIFSEAEAVTS